MLARRGLDVLDVLELEWLEQVVELIVAVVAHLPFLLASRARAGLCEHHGGIVPRMLLFSAIRVAEPWTPLGVVAFVAILIVIVGVVLWLIRRA